jgi:nitrogen fixation protein FixH
MNWGKGIITGMVLFMIFILAMCLYMFRMPADEYDHQYYEKGLNFDKDFDKERQVYKDHAQPAVNIAGKDLTITFVASAVGTVRFVRPSSEVMDKIFQLNTDGSKAKMLSVSSLVPGQWQMVLEWKSSNKFYLYQKEIFIK